MNLIGNSMTHLPTKLFNVNTVFIKSILRVIIYKVLHLIQDTDGAVVDSGGIPLYHLNYMYQII